MKSVAAIEQALNFVGLKKDYSNYEALSFLSRYQTVNYINIFFEFMSEKLDQLPDRNEILEIFNELNEINWKEIDGYNYKEDQYYIFLRLKIFLLTIDYETDLKEDEEWLNFFENKFIEYLEKK